MSETDNSFPDIPVVHQDDGIVVVHKPAGMLVHRGMGASAHEPFLLQAVRERTGRWVYPVHRLDRPTRGLVVFAFSSSLAGRLQSDWQTGTVKKSYRAIVRGWMPEAEGLRDEALDSPDNGALQEASTRWRELDRLSLPFPLGAHPTFRLALVELEPATGRWHQLRRHFSRMHHPIAGDTTHGDRHTNHFLQEKFGWWRLLLWARTLEFAHPATGEALTFEDDPARGLAPDWDFLKSLATAPEAVAA